ncbi:hypothetical protein, partial [Klebsiella aerogenes]|uniref:hypothetical protein n=1 Tax=Klebsiella aerogenes TaxID=548 RepID=UPI001CC4D75E
SAKMEEMQNIKNLFLFLNLSFLKFIFKLCLSVSLLGCLYSISQNGLTYCAHILRMAKKS